MNTDGPADRLDTLTREVLITSGESDVFHAPTGDGGSLCGMRDGDRRDLRHVPLRSVPCRACFSADVYESSTGRLGRGEGVAISLYAIIQ